MNPYDSTAVSAVWQRVSQGKQNDSLECTLAETIANEYRSRNTYLSMARLCWPDLFRRMAAEEGCHARRLSALYYLLYGCPPCQKDEGCPHICNLCEAVRDAFSGETKAAKNYQKLAQSYPEYADLFCSIAADEQRHARCLRSMTEQLLRK